ncbi:hypothetical protein ACZ11_13520 [Lysinibacillus xylanilyticus]|uniref:Uncharacterized protein n=1 Tax=Lysinibacillus xylanilyticus TaxID=582475 RepID=A0A0K9FFR4_9BACI|nr:hypothetical protein [Lysinibacillus xylanilyticus]KMY33082.1 hypothetical protein ACZ11_13520 [Lysinibacillus xylanilyticus]
MIYTKYAESVYKKYGVIVVKDSMSNKWRLVQEEDAFVYSKKFHSKTAAQKYLDELIGNIIMIIMN